MAIKVDILTTGVPTLERAAAAFSKNAKAMAGTDQAAAKLSKTDQKLIAHFKAVAAQANMSATQLSKLIKALQNAEGLLRGLAKNSSINEMSKSFTGLSSQIGKVRNSVGLLNKEMQATAALSSKKLTDNQYVKLVQNAKASIVLQQQLNAEIERQAKLTADIALLQRSRNPAVAANAENLRTAQMGTQQLMATKEKLVAVNKKVELSEQRIAAARNALALGADRAQERNLKAQFAAVERLRSRLNSLGNTKVPVSQMRSLKQEIYAVNLALRKTGESQKYSIGNISKDISKLETKFKAAERATLQWGNSSKYIMGGIARSFGAMTYSYAALAPLLAGIAVGSVVKQVYTLGTAFEYTTKYVDTLNDSIKSLTAGQVQEKLLDIDTLRRGPQEMAMAMKEFAKAGVEATNSIGQIEEMTKFATLAEMDLGEAVKMVVGQSKAFDQSFSDSANMIASAALSSATDIQELGTALSYTTELATVSGAKFYEVAAAMAVMANAGIKGSKAGTAIRSSIIRMQNPSEKLKSMLDDLGISWSAFTEQGQIKNLRTMFTELKRVTEALPPERRVAVLRELFGLRALRGGANLIRSMGGEFEELSDKIKASGEGFTFIEQKYSDLADTVQSKGEKLRAEFQKSLIKAFDNEGIKNSLDDLTAIVASDAFIDGLRDSIKALNFLAEGITGVARAVTELKDVGATLDFSNFNNLTNHYEKFKNLGESGFLKDTFLGDWIKTETDFVEKHTKALKDNFKARRAVQSPRALMALETKIDPEAPIISSAKSKVKFEMPTFDPEVGKLESEIQKAMDVGIDRSAFVLREKLDQLEDRLNFESEKKKLDIALGPMSLASETAVFEVNKAIDKIDYESGIRGLSEWGQKLAEVEKQVDTFVKEKRLSLNIDFAVVDQFRQRLKKDLLDEGLLEVQKASEDISFEGMIKELNASTAAVDKLKSKFLELRQQAYEKLNKWGQAFKVDGKIEFTEAGQRNFELMIEGSRIFASAVKDAEDRVKSLQQTLDNSKINFASSLRETARTGMTELQAWTDSVKEIREYLGDAELAFGAGQAEKYYAYLKQAEKLAQSLSTSQILDPTTTNDVTKELVAQEDQVRIKLEFQKAIQGELLAIENAKLGKVKEQRANVEHLKSLYGELNNLQHALNLTGTGNVPEEIAAKWGSSSENIKKAISNVSSQIETLRGVEIEEILLPDDLTTLKIPEIVFEVEKGKTIVSPEAKQKFEESIKSLRDDIDKLEMSEVQYLEKSKELAIKTAREKEGISRELIEKKVALLEQYYDIEIEKAQGSFFRLAQISDAVAANMSSNFSSFFSDLFAGEISNAEGVFKGFAQAIGDAFADAMARMVADFVAAQAKMALFGSDGTGGLVGSIIGAIVSAYSGAPVSSAGMSPGGTSFGSLGIGTPSSYTYSAKGNLFANSGISAYSDSIINKPITFYAKGGNVAGEAGPEAIMPLRRTSSGHLGVVGVGGGAVNNITIINNSGSDVQTSEEQNSSGGVDIEVMIGDMVAKQMNTPGTSVNKATHRTTGTHPAVVRR